MCERCFLLAPFLCLFCSSVWLRVLALDRRSCGGRQMRRNNLPRIISFLVKFSSGPVSRYDHNLPLTGVDDPQDPFNDNARPNFWTPPLNTTWDWATNHVYGVNLGGLFVIEPFITPTFFQKYPGAIDEWTLSEAMAADTGPGGGLQQQLEAHYDNFIVRPISHLIFPGADLFLFPTLYRRRTCSFTDRTRSRRDCRGRLELDSLANSVLGD